MVEHRLSCDECFVLGVLFVAVVEGDEARAFGEGAMINEWQGDWREDIVRLWRFYDPKIDEEDPSPFRHSYVYLSREQIEALLNGKSVSFYDGGYSHHLLMCEIEIEGGDGEKTNTTS